MSTRPSPDHGHFPPQDQPRWFAASAYFRRRLGGRARKVPLDAGLSCPNRDGTISRLGCSFCNPAGSGTGLFARGVGLAEQWGRFAPRLASRQPGVRLLGYLQAYTNTHAAPGRLRAILAEAAALPGLAGLCLGTRPDCLDIGAGEERLDILAEALRLLPAVCGGPYLQVDLGLQSADDAVLSRANRGHGAEVFALAARAAATRGLEVCAHLLHGLPGAAADDLVRSVAFVNALPVVAVKFHNLLVCRGAPLARAWRAGDCVPPGREEYLEALIRALELLRPDIRVERLFADPAPGELLAPDWAQDKAANLDLLRRELVRRDTWQGRAQRPHARPDWT